MMSFECYVTGGLQRVKSPQQAVNFMAAGETPWEVRFHWL